MNKFKIRLKALRKNKKLSQEQLAEKLGYTRHNIGDWERGKCEPNFDALLKIAIFFNETTDYLLGKDDISVD